MAMEYFKDKLEPILPEIVRKDDFFEPRDTNKKVFLSNLQTFELNDDNSSNNPPQTNMVLRKGIRKIKQGMKMYNNQLSVLRNEMRTCKRKSSEQSKQITEQQKVLAEQQKQILEYANRLDENDKKNEEISRKFSTLNLTNVKLSCNTGVLRVQQQNVVHVDRGFQWHHQKFIKPF
uniref:Uncharacterized protein n=1 Tax=Megaselia scalaris TaxID=36166 RepID=T1H4Z8_MEGSC